MEKILEGNGFEIMLVGMGVVYVGLLLISGFIAIIPRLLSHIPDGGGGHHGAAPAAPAAKPAPPVTDFNPSLMAAIAYVVRSEQEREESLQERPLSLVHHESRGTWSAVGRMRSLSNRL